MGDLPVLRAKGSACLRAGRYAQLASLTTPLPAPISVTPDERRSNLSLREEGEAYVRFDSVFSADLVKHSPDLQILDFMQPMQNAFP